jgi:hypothetical protein
MDPTPSVPELCTAIDGRLRISFVYHERERVAEPQCYGISTAGNEVLRAYLIKGRSGQPEPLFTVTEMKGLKLLDQTFTRSGPNYKRGDSMMKHIFCQL